MTAPEITGAQWHGFGCTEIPTPRRQTCFFDAAVFRQQRGHATDDPLDPLPFWADVWRPTLASPFKRYRLYRTTAITADCDHCQRRVGIGHWVIRYGKQGNFLCCLHCLRWRLVPRNGQDAVYLGLLSRQQYCDMETDAPTADKSLWLPLGTLVNRTDLGSAALVVWVDPEAPESHVVLFTLGSAELVSMAAVNPINGAACRHPHLNPDADVEGEIVADEQSRASLLE